jgi:hypothetical protein
MRRSLLSHSGKLGIGNATFGVCPFDLLSEPSDLTLELGNSVIFLDDGVLKSLDFLALMFDLVIGMLEFDLEVRFSAVCCEILPLAVIASLSHIFKLLLDRLTLLTLLYCCSCCCRSLIPDSIVQPLDFSLSVRAF